MNNEWAYIYSGLSEGGVRMNMSYHSALETAMEAHLDPTPDFISAECGIVVRIKRSDLPLARNILEREGLNGYKVV